MTENERCEAYYQAAILTGQSWKKIVQGAWQAALSAAPTPLVCKMCNGEYAVDSGGTHPWGEAALIPCPKCSPAPPEVEPVAEIVAEDLGSPFNAAQIRAHFYKEIPPIGTKLYAAPTQPDVEPLAWRGPSGWIYSAADARRFDTTRFEPLYASPPSPKASWDADGTPLNLEAAARDFVNLYKDESMGRKSDTFKTLRKFLPNE